ncbi:serine/threonine-protein kinase [Verrucomicrobiaceae bacterium 227]
MTDHPEATPAYEPCQACGELLDVTTFAPFEAAICPHCETETRVKREFGAYELKRRYAIGGMSVIFVGWDPLLGREVAIKVLNEEYCNDENRILAFENEARLTAQVNHPNVVEVYAVGRAYGRFYLVMELLEGQSFERIMSERGALPEAEVLAVALQVASGLQAAKKAGMIHRDVKPGNILIDSKGTTKLVDFGLALITQDGSAQAEEIWATPYYVPPEALERGTEDFRSDIYAFGATLYHALAGRPPFESTSTANKVLRRAKQTIPRLTKIAPWIGSATGETIDRMMAFKPEHRWESYGDVIASLENASRNPGTGKTTTNSSGGRIRRRNRSRTRFAILTFIAAAAASLAILKPREKKAGPVADEPIPDSVTETPQSILPSDGAQDQTTRIGKAWRQARGLVAKKEYAKSEQRFIELATDPSLPLSSRAWALLEASISAYLDGRPGIGRRHAHDTFLTLKDLQEKDPMVKAFRDLSSTLHRIPFPLPAEFPQNPKDIVGAMGTFALSLKLWEQGQCEAALPGFATVRNLTLSDEFRWFQRYQELADHYLADGELLGTLADLPQPESEDDANHQINKFGDAIKSLKTKGRARFNIRARQAYLSRLRKGFQERPLGSFNLSWDEMSKKLVESGKAGRFNELFAMIDNAPEEAPNDSLWAWNYLYNQAIGFIADLNQQSGWTAKTSAGQIIVPASAADEGLKLSDGTFIPWSEMDHLTLVTAQAGTRDPADQAGFIRAICYAWLVGLTDLAEQEAEKLAAEDPDFLKNWKRVLVGTSQ